VFTTPSDTNMAVAFAVYLHPPGPLRTEHVLARLPDTAYDVW
jgi:hypothetical protein